MQAQLNFLMKINSEQFSSAIRYAEEQTERLEARLEHIGEIGKEIGGIFAASLAVFKGYEYVKEALGEFVKVKQSQIEMNQLLKNQKNYSEEYIESLKKQREEYEKIGISADKTAAAQQAIINKFGKANAPFEEKMLKTVNNMTALGSSPEEAANEISKATLMAMRTGRIRGGSLGIDEINKFNGMHLKGSSPELIAEKIQDIYAKHFEGMYKQVHEADPFWKVKDAIVGLTPKVGSLANTIAQNLSPKLVAFVTYIDDLFKNHLPQIKSALMTLYETLKTIAEYFIASKIKETLIGGIEGIHKFIKIFKESDTEGILKKNMIINAQNVVLNSGVAEGTGGIGGGIGGGGSSKWVRGVSAFAPLGIMGGLALHNASQNVKGASGTTMDVVGSAMGGGFFGAEIGSAILPGIGTAIGAALGGLLGGGLAYWRRTAEATEKTAQIEKTPEQKNIDQFNTLFYKAENDKQRRQTEMDLINKNLEVFRQGPTVYGKQITDLGLTKQQLLEVALNPEMKTAMLADMQNTDQKLALTLVQAYKKEHNSNSGISPNSGLGSMSSESATVHGVQPKIINIIINDGIKTTITQHNQGIAESAEEMERVITQAILDGLEAAEKLSIH